MGSATAMLKNGPPNFFVVVEANSEYVSKKLDFEAAENDDDFEALHSEHRNLDKNMVCLKDAVQEAFSHITGGRITVKVEERGSG